MEHKICLLLMFWITFAVNVSEDIIFNFENGAILQGDVINVIEGTDLLLGCAHKTITPWAPTWFKKGEPEFRVISDKLHIDSFRVKHQGTYSCAFESLKGVSLKKSVKITCLYPPERPTIYGPREVIIREKFSLTCNTSAFPEASLWWTFDQEEASVIGRGSEFTFALQEVGSGWKSFTCWAENTMIPTVGEAIVAKQAAHKLISVQRSAYIWELNDTYTFYVGQTLDIICQVGGHPEPEVYWTKDRDKTFSYNGQRLFKQDVQHSYAGQYTCHAKNELFNGVKVLDMRNTQVLIKDFSVPSHCQEFCGSGVATDPACVSTKTTGVTLQSEKSSCDSSCGIVFIVIGVIGWSVAVILVVVCLFCWIKHRAKTPTEIKQQRRRPCTQEIDTGEREPRRKMSNLPYNILERELNVDHHYNQLEVGEGTAEIRPKSHYSGDYLTPMPRKSK